MDTETDVIRYIKNNMDKFSKRQRMIAEYIIENYDKASYMTASKLSSEVGVSESTVVRFAAELGFDGYQKLQTSLQEVTCSKLTSVQRMEFASQRIDTENVLEKVLQSDIEKIQKTLQEIDREQFDNIVDALINAENIYIIGVRSAASIAMFASFYFNLLFEHVKLINTSSASDVFEQIMRVSEKDVVFGISFPRYSQSTLRALEYANRKGAVVAGLTDSIHSPIVRLSKYCLTARSDMTSFADSLAAPISVLNALIAAAGMKKRKEVSRTFELLESIWDEYHVYEKRGDEYD